jgi:hypothetical protein
MNVPTKDTECVREGERNETHYTFFFILQLLLGSYKLQDRKKFIIHHFREEEEEVLIHLI